MLSTIEVRCVVAVSLSSADCGDSVIVGGCERDHMSIAVSNCTENWNEPLGLDRLKPPD